MYLSEVRSLAGLVLGHLVKGVLGALLSLAEGLSFLGYVHHFLDTDLQREFNGASEANLSERFP